MCRYLTANESISDQMNTLYITELFAGKGGVEGAELKIGWEYTQLNKKAILKY